MSHLQKANLSIIIDEDKFRDIYNEEKDKVGRPNKSVKTTISILTSYYMDGFKYYPVTGCLKRQYGAFFKTLCKQKPGLYESVAKELSRDSLAKDFDLTEKDREKAQRQIRVMAEDRLKERCPVKTGANVATLTLDERSYAAAALHHKYMEDPGYRKKCSIRAGAEAMVSELVRGHGVRKLRHRNERES